MEEDTIRPGKLSVTCDECKSRKVRCIKAPNLARPTCINCEKRGIECHFGFRKRRAKRPKSGWAVESVGDFALPATQPVTHDSQPTPSKSVDERPSVLSANTAAVSSQPSVASLQLPHPEFRFDNLYVDRLLEDKRVPMRLESERSIIKAHAQYIGSSGVAFFSDQRIESISARLGHRRFAELIEGVVRSVQSQPNRDATVIGNTGRLFDPSASSLLTPESAKLYLDIYFKCVHPIYPFLDRKMFEEDIPRKLPDQFASESPAFSALYYTVLALGCQSHRGISFKARTDAAWKLYQPALELLSETITAKEALLNVQAITAMAIFANNSLRMHLGHRLTSEAARMAQSLSLSKVIYDNENVLLCHRVFWVIYIIEKTRCFACSRVSIICDSEIAAPPPDVPEAMFGSFDRFQAMCRFSRLSSIIYDTLFSVSATLSPYSTIKAAVNAFHVRLEDWRLSIPEAFRPGTPIQPLKFLDDSFTVIAVETHYQYYSRIIALARVNLNIQEEKESSTQALLDASCKVIELTKFIDLEMHIPIWAVLSVPLSALFILFDFVIHNPSHMQTKSYLSLLGIAAGYFCRLEYTSGGVYPTSILSDVAHFAREFVRDVDGKSEAFSTSSMPALGSSSQPRSVSNELHSLLPASRQSGIWSESHIGDIETDNPLNPADDLLFHLDNRILEGIDLMDMFNADFSPCAMPLK